jgi:hypothetical protein
MSILLPFEEFIVTKSENLFKLGFIGFYLGDFTEIKYLQNHIKFQRKWQTNL